jgi:YHS domain-containing protein
MERDPVCGMELEQDEEAAWVVHDGRTYVFCSEACRRVFERDPARYVGPQERADTTPLR